MAGAVVASSDAGKCRVAGRLLAEGATSEWSARAFEPKNGREGRALEAAVAAGLVVRTGAGTYFVHAERYEALQVKQRWSIIVAVAAVLIGLAVLYLTGELTS